MDSITVVGIDPAFANFGMVRMTYDFQSDTLHSPTDMKLVRTKNEAGKTVRKSSDDLRRAMELSEHFHGFVRNAAAIFAEIPSGGQSARAAYSFGIAVGILASAPVPVIQVQPAEAKRAAVGTKTASKAEMIEWATQRWPHADWLIAKRKGQTCFVDANEHLADACAIVEAGIHTDQFRQILSVVRHNARHALNAVS